MTAEQLAELSRRWCELLRWMEELRKKENAMKKYSEKMNELEGWMDEAWETLESDGKLWMGDGGRKNITALTATTATTTESLTTNTSTNAQERLERIVDAVKALKVNCDELFYKKSKINHRFFRVFTFQACHDWLKN